MTMGEWRIHLYGVQYLFTMLPAGLGGANKSELSSMKWSQDPEFP